MIEWKRLPRGSLRCSYDCRTADVWHIGSGARWTVLNDATGVYQASGQEATEDAACETALRELDL